MRYITPLTPVASGGGTVNTIQSGSNITVDAADAANPIVAVAASYTEPVVAVGTVTTSSTLSLAAGTLQTVTLTASTACTFTMPTVGLGKSFTLQLKQAASTGNGTATFTGVDFGAAGTPTVTATAGKLDLFTFVSSATKWFGSYAQGFTA